MKRRNFLRGIGISSAAAASLHPFSLRASDRLPEYRYGTAKNLEEARSAEGLHAIRLELEEPPGPDAPPPGEWFRVRHGELRRAKSYFGNRIWVLWLKDAGERTEIRLTGRHRSAIPLIRLVEQPELSAFLAGIPVTANLLLDREIGKIDPESVGITDPGDAFSFVAMADPQGGDPEDDTKLKTRMKIHNAFIEESVDLVNNLDFRPLFTMVIGDVCDDWGYEKDLVRMNQFLSRIDSPLLYGIGNHETLLRSTFGPGYNMEAFNNYLAAQKAVNGLDKLLYSFDLGRWHFVVWPDPLRPGFWETHPHYFDWLERDLEAHKERPTMVFQHVPSHPVGITPHINYAESVDVKRTFLGILARHGQVRYVLSGHVHIPVKASFKTAVEYRGMKLITLPAAGYRPRAFGEEDFYGGPSQGIAMVHIRGDNVQIRFKTVTEEIYEYPDELPEFDEIAHPLWLNHPWELPSASDFRNGDFSSGLKEWAPRWVYREDRDPSNLCEVRTPPGEPGRSSLYLFARRRGYLAPGQDRLPQDINRISQAVSITPGDRPVLRFRYRIDGSVSDPEGFSGGYAWIEGFAGTRKRFNLMYSAGRIWVNIGGKYHQTREFPHIQMALDETPDRWHEATLDVAADHDGPGPESRFADLGVDRLVLNLGVWNLNDGEEYPFGIHFTGIELERAGGNGSHIGGRPVNPKPKEKEWWRNKLWPWANIAGEHRYIIATRDPMSS